MSDNGYPASPCVGRCQMDAQRQYCQGCRRTLAEIAGWSTMDIASRRRVLQELDDRGQMPLDTPAGSGRGLA
ncbi:DUF1289 domain-containing protein [Methylonatrum kenyense]|uniref:DUF1289 domain-containing protein n=1 Tax=Methylonatrum kenyense TaxID=455253 RepID=UPI0020C12E3B|nr:DUF1289 domain-containing protein [Methylonatrum kenyense]MCK8516558.1 DUF1289 domain-containing protein [Methylonatrum kenyense]